MRPTLVSVLCLVLLACQPPDGQQSSAEATASKSDRPWLVKNPAFYAVIDSGGGIERLASGFGWSEGPLWLPEQQRLIFSDVPRNQIYSWQEGDSAAQPWLMPSGYTGPTSRPGESGSNGLALDREGQLLLCQHGDHRVARMAAPLAEPSPAFQTLAQRYQEKRLNSPNDLCLSRGGQVFFTDPPYGLAGGPDDPARELNLQGVYRIDSDGRLTLLVDSLTRPNGIALSPDERTLYVANSDSQKALWMAYQVDEQGNLTGGEIFYDVTDEVGEEQPGLPDGLKVDARGNVLATGPGGLWIFSPQAELLGRVMTGLHTSNCALAPGYVYLTADSLLLRVRRAG